MYITSPGFSHISSEAALGKRASPVSRCEQKLACSGANIRSLTCSESSYSFHRVPEQDKPDLLFLIETWHQENSPRLLLDQNYRILLSKTDDQRGGGVAIVHSSRLIVTPLFREFHSRNFLLARLSSVTARPIILIAVYFPPDQARKRQMIAHVVRVLDFLHSRYRSFGLLTFGDLNSDFFDNSSKDAENRSKLLKVLKSNGLSVHAAKEPGTATRVQGSKASYLDYFLSMNVEVTGLKVGEAIGSSDY